MKKIKSFDVDQAMQNLTEISFQTCVQHDWNDNETAYWSLYYVLQYFPVLKSRSGD